MNIKKFDNWKLDEKYGKFWNRSKERNHQEKIKKRDMLRNIGINDEYVQDSDIFDDPKKNHNTYLNGYVKIRKILSEYNLKIKDPLNLVDKGYLHKDNKYQMIICQSDDTEKPKFVIQCTPNINRVPGYGDEYMDTSGSAYTGICITKDIEHKTTETIEDSIYQALWNIIGQLKNKK